jgi:hypothetical protein
MGLVFKRAQIPSLAETQALRGFERGVTDYLQNHFIVVQFCLPYGSTSERRSCYVETCLYFPQRGLLLRRVVQNEWTL